MKPIGAPQNAIDDVIATGQHWALWSMMGWNDIKARYRGSVLGPLWITVALGVTVGGVGVLYSQLLKIPTETFLPYLAATLVVWTFMMGVLSESTAMFQGAAAIMQQVAMPKMIHLMRMIWRHLIIFAHNFLVFVVVAAIFKVNALPGLGYAFIGAILMVLNIGWIALVVGLLSARFRDMPQIILNTLTFITIMTPVYWMPEILGRDFPLIKYNLFNYWLEAVRAPLLGREFHFEALLVSLASAVLGWGAAIAHFQYVRSKIIHWV
jgi:ABC-type polysaccharide/polyol phosphate export permease